MSKGMIGADFGLDAEDDSDGLNGQNQESCKDEIFHHVSPFLRASDLSSTS